MSIVVEPTVDPTIADSSAYRAFLSIDEGPEVIDRIAEQFSSWLREKGWDLAAVRQRLLRGEGPRPAGTPSSFGRWRRLPWTADRADDLRNLAYTADGVRPAQGFTLGLTGSHQQ